MKNAIKQKVRDAFEKWAKGKPKGQKQQRLLWLAYWSGFNTGLDLHEEVNEETEAANEDPYYSHDTRKIR